MTSTRVLTLGPNNEPRWVRLAGHAMGDHGTTMIVAANMPLPKPTRSERAHPFRGHRGAGRMGDDGIPHAWGPDARAGGWVLW